MVEIVFNKENKMAIAYDDNIQVGECVFIENGNVWNIVHTGVNVSYQGHGIAKKLVDCVIANAELQGKKILADCSYAKRLLERYGRDAKK